jgi:hypothetical protein
MRHKEGNSPEATSLRVYTEFKQHRAEVDLTSLVYEEDPPHRGRRRRL